MVVSVDGCSAGVVNFCGVRFVNTVGGWFLAEVGLVVAGVFVGKVGAAYGFGCDSWFSRTLVIVPR